MRNPFSLGIQGRSRRAYNDQKTGKIKGLQYTKTLNKDQGNAAPFSRLFSIAFSDTYFNL
jgi:hypothetical protein